MSTVSASYWKTDLLAALTVTLVGIPQCLAYAMMSGLPPAYGLATAAIPGLVAALVGSSPHIVTGPTNTTGLLILAAMGPYLQADGFVGSSGLSALATLVLLAGVIRIVAALLGGASLIRFLPESVLAGFTAGAGLLILIMQLDEAMGLRPVADSGLFGEFSGLSEQWRQGVRPALPALCLTLGTAAAIGLGKRFTPHIPIALLVVLGAATFAALTGVNSADGLPLVSDRSLVPNAWPPGALPSLELGLVGELFIPAAAIALLGTLELAVSARADGARPDMKREITAQGLANVVGAFTSSFPASASLTRSALLRIGNAQTRLAPVGAALFTVPVLFFGGTLVGYIPQASLAGVLLAVALRMINLPRVRLMWGGSKTIRVLLAATLLATLILPLEWAVVVGAGLGLTIHLRQTTSPAIRLYYPTASGLEPWSTGDMQRRRVLQVSGSLYYAAVDPLIEALEAQTSSADTLVVDVSYAQELGYSALQALHRASQDMAARNGQFIVSGVEPAFQRLIDRTEVNIPTVPRGAVPGEALGTALRQVAPDLTIDTDDTESALLFRQLFDRDSCTYTYLIGCAKTKEAALIDTVEAHVDRDIKVLNELGLALKYVLETHLHSDHVTGAQRLIERTGCALVVSQGSNVACADQEVTHGDVLRIGELNLDVLSTPGHTGACVTYLLADFSMAFTGDTVLVRGCGRTDYADGDSGRLYRSVHEKIFTLPDETRLYPAHDYKGRTVTTVAEEKAQNPRLAEGIALSEFIEIMASLDLPSPRLMAVALPANRGGGRRGNEGSTSWPVVTRHDGIPEVESIWVAKTTAVRKIDVRNLSDLIKSPAPIPGSSHVPLSKLEGVAAGWDRCEPLVLISQKGVRSAAGVQMLLALGFSEVASMRGGWSSWPKT